MKPETLNYVCSVKDTKVCFSSLYQNGRRVSARGKIPERWAGHNSVAIPELQFYYSCNPVQQAGV